MAVLLTNHHMLAEDKKMQEAILKEAVELCIRIRTESKTCGSPGCNCFGSSLLSYVAAARGFKFTWESIRPVSTRLQDCGPNIGIMRNE